MPSNVTTPGSIVAYLSELLKLSPAQLIGTSILMQKRLSTATTSGSDEYRVPADRDLVVFQIQSTFRSSLIATEVATNAIFTAHTLDDLEEIRSSNCLVGILNKDRQLKVFDNRDIPLNAIRKTPIYFPAMAPLLIPATHTLQATFTLQDTTAAVVGAAADYGVMLTGVLIPKRI